MAILGTLKLNSTQDAESQERVTDLREQWINVVTDLVQQVTAWAAAVQEEHHWTLEAGQIELAEEIVGGTYRVPTLIIHAEGNALHLEPIARGVLSAEGRVDLSAWPSLFRVMLLRKNDTWIVRTESGLDWPQTWSEQTFLTIAEGLLQAG
jgi:hypothetical protein